MMIRVANPGHLSIASRVDHVLTKETSGNRFSGVVSPISTSNAARRYDDGCHVSRPLLFVACSFVAQDADATTACSSAVSTHVGVL